MERVPEYDYIVAKVLPFMPLEHETIDGLVRDFTLHEGTQLDVGELPLLVNHNDGEENARTGQVRPLMRVGTVKASAVDGVHARVLADIDPMGSGEATVTSNFIADGTYKAVSLGNDVSTIMRASASTSSFVKTPLEVSVCKRGRRLGSDIEAFCPGTVTLARLATDPASLEHMIDHHGYRQALIDAGVTSANKDAYIATLTKASNDRLRALTAQYSLHPHATTVRMQASDATDSPPEQPATTPAEPAPAPPAAAAAPAAAPAPPATRAIETPSIAAAPDQLKAIADDALKFRALAAERAKELAAEREARAKAEAEAALGRAAIAREAAQVAEKKRKDKEELEKIIVGFSQRAEQARTPKQDIDKTVASARALYDDKPELALGMLETAMHMAVRAADSVASTEKAAAANMFKLAQTMNNNFLNDYAKKMAAYDASEVSLQRSSYPTTALETRFEQPPTAPETPAAPPASSAVATTPPPPSTSASAPARKRSYDTYVEKEAPQHFSIKASDSVEDEYPVGQVMADFMAATGQLPSMKQLQYGEHFVATGRMQASADGRTETPVYERKYLRRTPAKITPWNYPPGKRFAALLDKAQAQVAGIQNRERFGVQFISSSEPTLLHR